MLFYIHDCGMGYMGMQEYHYSFIQKYSLIVINHTMACQQHVQNTIILSMTLAIMCNRIQLIPSWLSLEVIPL